MFCHDATCQSTSLWTRICLVYAVLVSKLFETVDNCGRSGVRTSENSAPSKTNVFCRLAWLTAARRAHSTPPGCQPADVPLARHCCPIISSLTTVCCCDCIADQWPNKPPFEPKTAPLALHQVVAVSPGGQQVIRLPGYDLDGDELVATITSLPGSGTLHQVSWLI